MELKCPNFGNLYLFIKRNSDTIKANNGFRLVEQYCEIHSLDSTSLKELCFYFGASEDKEVLTKVKGNISVKASIRPRGYKLNKMARS